MQNNNIISDLSTFTKIPNKALIELVNKEILCIGSAVHDAKMLNEQQLVLNIGIGSLSIDLQTMQCKFVPSKELKKCIKNSLETGIDPVEFDIEKSIIEKLISICEEVI